MRTTEGGVVRPAVLAAAVVTMLTGCGMVRSAEMALPAFATPVERLELTGLGGWTSGSFQMAGYSGRFSRRESRLGLFDPYFVSNRGGSSFVVTGPDLVGQVEAECGMIRNTVNVKSISVDVSKMIYRCAFALDGQPLNADFRLVDSIDSVEAMMSVSERRGEVLLNGTRLTVRSTNRIVGSSLPTETPIGYVMEWAGAPMGAVELNGSEPVLYLPVGTDPDVRGAVILAAVSLSVFWDPANSMLDP